MVENYSVYLMVNPEDPWVTAADFARQIEREQRSITGGSERYLKKFEESSFVDTTLGGSLLNKAMPQFVVGIERLLGALKYSAPSLYQLLSALDPMETAAVSAACILNHCHSTRAHEYLRACKSIGMALCQQLAYSRFKRTEPHLLKYVLGELKSQSQIHKLRVLNWYFGRFNTKENLSEELKIHLGIKLVETFVTTTGLVEVMTVANSYRLCFSTETMAWIARSKLKCLALDPVVEPMLIPPLNWHGIFNGGFVLNGIGFGFPFIRTNSLGVSIAQAHDISGIYAVANHLQHTPWCINRYIFDTLDTLVGTGGLDSVLPVLQGIDPPERPWGTGEPTRDELKAWKAQAAEAYALEHSEQSKRIQFYRKFNLASHLKDIEKFYYVWSCDFRGRYNVVQTWVTPQSDDIGKALIRFHRELPATAEGMTALEIHLANEWGNDKCSYGDRIKWVHEHWSQLRQSVASPLDDRWWTQADKPWQFLAAAEEYVGLKLNTRSTHSVPVSADGSCNGFQHLSAMLRDPQGATAVNLQSGPGDMLSAIPADIYTTILNAVKTLLADEGGPLADAWLPVLDRKLLKRNVMTSPYSVTLEGMKQQLYDELKSRGVTDKALLFTTRALAQLVCRAREARLAQAMGAMGWLKYVAQESSRRDAPMIWVTPNGFPVLQYYKKYKSKRIDLITGKHRISLSVNGDPQGLDKQKQSLGIAPNFVHSMDACHLSMTITAAVQSGIVDFAPVHDSYGTHACNMPLLGHLLRQAFVQLYQRDVLMELKISTEGRLACSIREPPEKGTFDINCVLYSPHFFNNIPRSGNIG